METIITTIWIDSKFESLVGLLLAASGVAIIDHDITSKRIGLTIEGKPCDYLHLLETSVIKEYLI